MARLNKQKRPGFHRESLTLTNGVKPFRSADKADESKELEDQVQKFLDQGGKIEQEQEASEGQRKGALWKLPTKL